MQISTYTINALDNSTVIYSEALIVRTSWLKRAHPTRETNTKKGGFFSCKPQLNFAHINVLDFLKKISKCAVSYNCHKNCILFLSLYIEKFIIYCLIINRSSE